MSRAAYILLAVGTMAVGLLVHLRGDALDAAARDVIGDVLWASMIHWWLGAVAPRVAWPARAALALGVCVSVELSQLSTSGALAAVRATRIGHLFLGSGYDPRDLLAYAVGVTAAAGAERVLAVRRGARERM